LSAVESLALARDQFYAQGHFADAFAAVKRAPLALAEVLRGVPGVADVQVTVEQVVRVEIAGLVDPIIGQLIGVDLRQPPRMNQVTVRSGRALAPPGAGQGRSDSAIDALVSEGFARVRGLHPGDELIALVNGKRRTLRIVGTALSPEYIFAGLAGMPDLRGFGVFWVDREALAAAYDMQGAFNRVAVKLAPQASEPAVLDGLSRLLAPYGGRDARGREDQSSHAMLDNEIKEQRVMGTLLPAIFLAVAAFLLHVVLSRLVATQREQIAALKALGYANAAIAGHYLKLVAVIVVVGLALGVALGNWLGTMLTGLYAEFFFFPVFEHRIAPWLILVGAGVTGHRPAGHAQRHRGHRAPGPGRGHAPACPGPVPAHRAGAPGRAPHTGRAAHDPAQHGAAYIERQSLNQLLREGDAINQLTVSVERGHESELLTHLKNLPRVAAAVSKSVMKRNIDEVTARNVLVFSGILSVFATIIATGVVYNNARIALAERAWELASLRVLGFTRVEVSAFLLGELAIEIALAIPLGMALGYGLASLIVHLIKTDEFFFPMVIGPATYAYAVLCVVAAGAVSGLIVRRRVDMLDLVGVLKTRE
jgi:ABC-type antimicrobial peptide transport system permease subunit